MQAAALKGAKQLQTIEMRMGPAAAEFPQAMDRVRYLLDDKEIKLRKMVVHPLARSFTDTLWWNQYIVHILRAQSSIEELEISSLTWGVGQEGTQAPLVQEDLPCLRRLVSASAATFKTLPPVTFPSISCIGFRHLSPDEISETFPLLGPNIRSLEIVTPLVLLTNYFVNSVFDQLEVLRLKVYVADGSDPSMADPFFVYLDQQQHLEELGLGESPLSPIWTAYIRQWKRPNEVLNAVDKLSPEELALPIYQELCPSLLRLTLPDDFTWHRSNTQNDWVQLPKTFSTLGFEEDVPIHDLGFETTLSDARLDKLSQLIQLATPPPPNGYKNTTISPPPYFIALHSLQPCPHHPTHQLTMITKFQLLSRSSKKLSTLPEDILYAILDVSELDAIFKLPKVCRRLNAVVAHLLYSKIVLVNQPGRAILLFRGLIVSPRLAQYIRSYKCIVENTFDSTARAIAAEFGQPIAGMQELALRGARNLESLEVEVGPNLQAEDSACMMNTFRIIVSPERAQLRRLSLHFPPVAPRFQTQNRDGELDRKWEPVLRGFLQAQPLLEELEVWGLIGRVQTEDLSSIRFNVSHLQTLRSDCVPLIRSILASNPPIRTIETRNMSLRCVVETVVPRLMNPSEVQELLWTGRESDGLDSCRELGCLSTLLPNVKRLGLGFSSVSDDHCNELYRTTCPEQLRGFLYLQELDFRQSRIPDTFMSPRASGTFANWAAVGAAKRLEMFKRKDAQNGSISQWYGLNCQNLTRVLWPDGSQSYRLEGSDWIIRSSPMKEGEPRLSMLGASELLLCELPNELAGK
ncbi:hypothetical protein FRB90_012263 [Tulasnella sp. 427]|nr:hypothetical protein FRB90_012263 [Tulasnella sp. 427]